MFRMDIPSGASPENDYGILSVQAGKLEEVLEALEEFTIAPAVYNIDHEPPDPDLFHAYPLVDAARKFIFQAMEARKEAMRRNME
jgi:hypothetical protein